MKKLNTFWLIALAVVTAAPTAHSQSFEVGATGYFEKSGVNVMAFDDIYPEGHQGGVALIMHGNRVATGGDIRFEPTPGQWQPLPKQQDRKVDTEAGTITAYMSYPDSTKHLSGFNPMIYPDFVFNYTVKVTGEKTGVRITVDLDRPVPEEFLGKVGFNFELFPGALFGKPWIMDSATGIFPRQPNGPTLGQPALIDHTGDFYTPKTDWSGNPQSPATVEHLVGPDGFSPIVADDIVAEPYAVGRKFTVRPDDPYNRFTIEALSEGELKLYDGRMNHNNGWFVVRSEVAAGKTKGAIEWVITPNVVEEWVYAPVVQTSQIGYHPAQPKVAIIELDKRDTGRATPILYKITEEGEKEVAVTKAVKEWGRFLRYDYLQFDFTEVREEGLYMVRYGDAASSIFRIASDVYDRGVWQPVLEYFLPVQMCHVRVNEKYRVWHDACHTDDARLAPVGLNHIDGYTSPARWTTTKYAPGESVPGVNIGGWHDAGDDDIRHTTPAEAYILTLAKEAFGVDYDATSIDQTSRVVEIHQPDGRNDIQQQIENGVLWVMAGYKALGVPPRGTITNNIRAYTLLGDTSSSTDNVFGNKDDRWIYPEESAGSQLSIGAQMAAASRALKGHNDELAAEAFAFAVDMYDRNPDSPFTKGSKIHAAVELYLTTGEAKYSDYLLAQTDYIVQNIGRTGWYVARAEKKMANKKFTRAIREAMTGLKAELDSQSAETPYGVPYRPAIWGAGWSIQEAGYTHYFLHAAYPDIFPADYVYNALNFVLGCHPGSNTSSFASGVGAVSATVGYGLNRADWSYIPGGVVSGTALIRPDFPELLVWPYLWQQVEYVMGGGSSHYMFLVLAAQQLTKD
ncbi:MAG: glycoside hydrolase family 9 protein [Rikenellaceae bacterium]|jgi:hypothetical protein|nr:glycoside hydrolase family 9 protein [Rikenellaceae bacterium]